MIGQIQFESGGNPAALNPADSDGLPAIGLGQFKRGTFNAHNITGGDINDGVAQVYAMIDYVATRYGQSSSGVPNGINQGHGYAIGGGVPGSGAGDTVPAMLTPGEHVLTTRDVAALGGQSGVYAFREALHFAPGGAVPTGVVIQPLPPNPSRQMAKAPRPAPPVTAAPAAPAPRPVTPPPAPQQPATAAPAPEQAAPPPAQPPVALGPSPVAPGGGDGTHVLPAVAQGITSAASAAGNIASAAASLGGFGGGAGGLISGLFGIGGKALVGAANVGASLLVGNVPGSMGDPNMGAYGETQRPVQKAPQTAALGPTTVWNNTFHGYTPNDVVDRLELKEAQNSQALLATQRG